MQNNLERLIYMSAVVLQLRGRLSQRVYPGEYLGAKSYLT